MACPCQECESCERLFQILRGLEIPILYDGEFGFKRDPDGSNPALFLGTPKGNLQIPLGSGSGVILEGDVLSSGDGVTTIAQSVVTNTKLAVMPANTIKGRIGTSGEPTDLTINNLKLMLEIPPSIGTITGVVAGTGLSGGGSSGQVTLSHPSHSGEVTGSSALIITNKAVTNQKLADMPASTIKGAIVAGQPQDLSVSDLYNILNLSEMNNYNHPNHSGDVTSIGDGATTIAARAVTNTKMANMAANTIKGRHTTPGTPEDLSMTQLASMLEESGINSYEHPNHYGDVSSISDGQTNISNGVVTNSKLANMNAGTIKGRKSADDLGPPQDIMISELSTMLSIPVSDNLSSQGVPTFNQAVQDGSLSSYARSDHVHAMPDLVAALIALPNI